jgi:probable DNA repair protein
MTSDAWPKPARPHPLLPIELQRSAEMPGASAATDLQRARRQLQSLLQAAPEVIVSHATVDGDRRVAPSPLIASLPECDAPTRARRLIDALSPAPLESFIDAVAPRWQPIIVLPGGTSIVRDQAACPFRAFATHRLKAEAIEPPHDGFDYRERGQLVHDVLARFWAALPEPTRDALHALSIGRRRDLLNAAATAAHQRIQRRRSAMSPALVQMECARLARVVDRWLQFELDTRAAFRVVAIEEPRTMAVGPLTFTARLDRVDELPDGARVIIDYKTGGAKSPAWLDERPDEPQLPLYLTATEPQARAVALARVRANGMGYSSFAAAAGIFRGGIGSWTKRFNDWESLVEFWSTVLDRLASQFAAGEAAVDPKRLSQTCRYCELPTLCRINERGGFVIPELPDEDEVQWMLEPNEQ